jgi:hypothetical protein
VSVTVTGIAMPMITMVLVSVVVRVLGMLLPVVLVSVVLLAIFAMFVSV